MAQVPYNDKVARVPMEATSEVMPYLRIVLTTKYKTAVLRMMINPSPRSLRGSC